MGAAEAVRTSSSKRWWGQSPQLSYPARKDHRLVFPPPTVIHPCSGPGVILLPGILFEVLNFSPLPQPTLAVPGDRKESPVGEAAGPERQTQEKHKREMER